MFFLHNTHSTHRKMRNKALSKLVIAVIIAVIIIAGVSMYLLLGNQNNSPSSVKIDISKISASLVLGGSTFINPQMQAWIQQFSSIYPNIAVTYQAVGSGAGVNNFIKGTYDIGATDVPMPTDLWSNATTVKGSVITIPDIVGGVAIIFNLPNFNSSKNGNLNLTADVLAGIYSGNIIYWDDSLIQSINPGFNFPHEKIVAVHRSDGSGTTFVFTLWLFKSSNIWVNSNIGYGYTVNWPVDKLGGLAGKGSGGVTAYVKQTSFSIGYVEVQYAIANNLQTAAIRNPAGNYVLPTPQSVSLSLQSIDISKFPNATQDWSNITALLLNSPNPSSYPIVTFSYLVVQKNFNDQNKAIAIYVFLEFIFTTGQKQQNIINGYLPLPGNVQSFVLNELKLISFNNQPVYQLL